MTVNELIEWLKQHPGAAQVYRSSPVQGDSENVVDFLMQDLDYDDRYPAVVIF